MATVVAKGDVGTKICEALGLEASKVFQLDLSMRTGSMVEIRVGMYVDRDNLEGLATVFKKYQLVEKEG